MQLSYDGILFDVLFLKNWQREAVYTEDKTSFLYWHHVIEVDVTINDEAINAEHFPKLVNGVAQNPFEPGQNKPLPARRVPVGRKFWQIAPGKAKPWATGGQVGLAARQVGISGIGGAVGPDAIKDVPGAIAGGKAVGAPGEAKPDNPRNVFDADDELGVAKPGPGAGFNAGIDKKFQMNVGMRARVPVKNRNRHTVPMTDKELRFRLSRPRKNLAVWLYTGPNGQVDYILQSPQAGASVDALTGPLCSITNVTAIHGQMTEVMSLRFETWEAPTIEFQGSQRLRTPGQKEGLGQRVKTPAVLSHRWKMSFGWHPETHLRTRNIEGEVIFRHDVLELRGLSADQLRPYFLSHRIPVGYVRVPEASGMIELNSEGNGVRYKITDEQQMTNFPGGAFWGAVNISAKSKFQYQTSQMGQLVTDNPDLAFNAFKTGFMGVLNGFDDVLRKILGAGFDIKDLKDWIRRKVGS